MSSCIVRDKTTEEQPFLSNLNSMDNESRTQVFLTLQNDFGEHIAHKFGILL